jgi:hypothetical protein
MAYGVMLWATGPPRMRIACSEPVHSGTAPLARHSQSDDGRSRAKATLRESRSLDRRREGNECTCAA